MFLIGLLLLGGAVTLFFFFDRNWIVLTGSVAMLLFSILAFMKSFSKGTGNRDEEKHMAHYQLSKIDKIKAKNDMLKPILKENLSQLIYNHIISKDILIFPIAPFFEQYQKFSDILSPLETQKEINNEQIASIYSRVLQISPNLSSYIRTNYLNAYIEIINDISNIIKRILPNSNGIDLQTHLNYSTQVNLNQQILSTIEPYLEKMTELESLRIQLLHDFPKIKEILTKSGWTDAISIVGQTLLGTFVNPTFFIGAGVQTIKAIGSGLTEEKIIENYRNSIYSYLKDWDDLIAEFGTYIIPSLQNTTLSFVKKSINNIDFLFDEFSNNGIELEPLNNDIVKVLAEQEKKLNDRKQA